MQGTQLQRPIKDTLTSEWAKELPPTLKSSSQANFLRVSLLWFGIFSADVIMIMIMTIMMMVTMITFLWHATSPSPFILVPPSGCLMRLFPFSSARLHHYTNTIHCYIHHFTSRLYNEAPAELSVYLRLPNGGNLRLASNQTQSFLD